MITALPARWRSAWTSRGVVGCLVALVAAGCSPDEAEWVAFNAPNDEVEVSIEPVGSPAGDLLLFDLRSNTGAVLIGQASVDPGSGPVGTEHRLQVFVDELYMARVTRGEVEVEGSRGAQVFPMRRDSASLGAWDVTVQSLGAADEDRVDVFRVRLYESVDTASVVDTSDE